jgi:hypothetical protein
MAEKPTDGLFKRLGRGFDRYVGGLLGEDLEGMSPEEKAAARRSVIGIIGRGMIDPSQGSEALGAVTQARAQRRAQGELERRTAAAEAAMPDIASYLFGGTGGRRIEELPGVGGESTPLTARRVPTREGARKALGMLYGTQEGRDVATMAPDLAKLATESVTGVTVGGSRLYPLTGQFVKPPEAQVQTLTPQEVAALSPAMRGAIIQRSPSGEFNVVSQPPRVAGGGGAGGAAGGSAPGAPPDLSKSERDRIIQIRERMASSQEGVAGLTEARRLSDLAFEGPMAGFRATAGAALPGAIEPEGAQATIEFDMLLKQQVLPQLKSIFGAAPTEGERKILLELQGSSSLPRAVRNKILDRAIAAAQRRMAMDQQEEAALLSGSYFSKPMSSVTPPAAPAAPGAPAAPAAAPAAPAAPQYIYRNGRLVPAQPR